ncbi:MAG: hypothetical protein NT079_01590 [Candidatus Omnitrophica bacterium]|nr:hypothetical protein [Candidatus Omnitrophota bacterium]
MVQKLLSVLKFFLFLCLIPLGIGLTKGFGKQLFLLDPPQINCFLAGIICYLGLHLFIIEPAGIYQYGKGLVADIFKFFQPLFIVAPLVLPIYSILLLAIFYFLNFFVKNVDLSVYFLFFTSLTFAMHMILTARDLREQDSETLKSTYFFSITLIYFICLITLALMMSLILERFSFIDFLKTTSSISEGIYRAIFNQLFVPR